VFFSAFLSISLGLFNLFPIPVLDGGQIWFLLAEAVRGRPLSRRVREITQQVGLGLLVLLMLFAFYNDISRIVTGSKGF
jgi:regulator of sigma E protease